MYNHLIDATLESILKIGNYSGKWLDDVKFERGKLYIH